MPKLLKFKVDDYNNEIVLMAIACVKDDTFEKLLNTPIGIVNDKYDIQKLDYDNQIRMRNDFLTELVRRGIGLNPRLDRLSQEDHDWYMAHNTIIPPNKPMQTASTIYYRDEFCIKNNISAFEGVTSRQQLIDAKVISVMDVDDDFYNNFHKLNMGFNNCNIFYI